MYESASISRVNEMELKSGTDRHEHYASGSRCLNSQHRTKVISHTTLMEMLRSKCLWICLDDDSH
uniref:Uncharacterized protein n=1 Tax=Arion vulgaris TaxID=1028688 RepID=A0A0B7AP42_9EUPU